MMKGPQIIALSILGALLFQACAHGGGLSQAGPDPDAELRNRLALATGQTRVEAVRLPWEADAPIARIAKERTRRAHTEFQRLTSLLAWFREQNFPADYNRLGSLTAVEAFERRGGNCLAYANLFVAMARSVDLKARFAALRKENHDFARAGSLLVDTGHMAVLVQTRNGLQVVDFDGDLKSLRRYQPIGDRRALAQFYNNLGYEWTQRPAAEGGGLRSEAAIQAFRTAVGVDPDFAWAWNNLGVSLSRSGERDRAEKAYLQATRAEPGLAAPHANLGHLLLKRQKSAAAVEAFERAVELQPDNAHYLRFLQAARKADRWQRDARREDPPEPEEPEPAT